MLPSVTATRYVTPLREGGSLPGLMEADDFGTYVVKWRAAGQGVKVLVAEVVCGELARALGLPVPALVTVDVAPELAVGEPDVEVQELLQRSAGWNLGLDYLPGALDFEAGADGVDPGLAGRVTRDASAASAAATSGSHSSSACAEASYGRLTAAAAPGQLWWNVSAAPWSISWSRPCQKSMFGFRQDRSTLPTSASNHSTRPARPGSTPSAPASKSSAPGR